MRRPLAIAALCVAAISAGDLVFLASNARIPSALLGPLSGFVHPGVLVWCLALGTLFTYTPTTPAAIAMAALANTAIWVFMLWLLLLLLRGVRGLRGSRVKGKGPVA